MKDNNTAFNKRYVWLSPDYKFSNSWNEETHSRLLNENDILEAKNVGGD